MLAGLMFAYRYRCNVTGSFTTPANVSLPTNRPIPTSKYYKEEYGQAWAQYDPDLANQLLDEMGLDQRDADGFRLRPDGEKLSYLIEKMRGQHLYSHITLQKGERSTLSMLASELL